MGKNLYCFKTSSYLVHFMFVFTLQIAMATVTMEIFWSFVKHHFLIVVVPILNQIIKKILTKLIAVYLYKHPCSFLMVVGRTMPYRAPKMP